ncbi:hypothetical protein Scep_004177 [Stephania cephalantha]|uniref:Uncharacterized protein n=1 Tax=Stephania cephalantha TaxID=152367 RepID=A0AAP0KRY1_9MAGN
MAYASRLLREQSIAKKSFVEVMPRCPLLLCLVGDRSVRQRATAPLLHAVHRAAADVDVAAAPPRRRHCSSPASWWTAPLLVVSPTRSRHLLPPLLLTVRPPAGATEARRPSPDGATH